MEKGSKGRYYEGCGQEGPVLCIFLCEFHPTYGPKITCQVPKEFISKETFESVNVYLIPKPQLIRSIITVTLDDIKIVGYPVRIENRKYPRNAFYYNLCFICDSWARTNQYDQVVKDLSAYLRQLEEDENLLSKMDEGGNQTRLSGIFTRVLSDINTNRLSCLQEGKRSVVLRVGRQGQVEIQRSGTVPMILSNQVGIMSAMEQTDPTALVITNKILQFVDGLTQIERIASLAELDLNKVKTSLQNLVRDGVVKLVPEFSDTNMYVVTPRIHSLLLDKQLQSDCLLRVSSQGGLANVRDVMRVYTSFNRGATIRDLCLRFDMAQMRLDERKLVQFGILHGLLRKLNTYINYLGAEGSGSNEEMAQYSIALDGTIPYELACIHANITRHHVDHLVHTNSSFIAINK